MGARNGGIIHDSCELPGALGFARVMGANHLEYSDDRRAADQLNSGTSWYLVWKPPPSGGVRLKIPVGCEKSKKTLQNTLLEYNT